MRAVLTVVALLVAALVAASLVLFVLRGDDEVERADAVVVLSGSRTRLPVALDLIERGVADTLVVSDPTDPKDTARRDLCAHGSEEFEVVCERPDPYSTRGEARMVARLARERGWGSVVVVTSRFHLFRAKRLFERCFDGEVEMRGSPVAWWYVPVAASSEWVKLALAETTRRGC